MLFNTERYFRISEGTSIENAKMILLGVPFDSTELVMPGQRFAPDEIRKALLTMDIGHVVEHVYDAGNVNVVHGDIGKTMERVEDALAEISGKNQDARYLILGGEHTISYASARFFAKKYKTLQLVFFDAHGDAYDEYNGLKLMHATVLRRMSELKNVFISTVGIRAEAEGISSLKTFAIEELDKNTATYVSIDLDVLDPSIMGSVADPVPSGLKLEQVVETLKGFRNIVGVDVVELNPLLDNNMLGAKMAAWLCAKIMELVMR